MATAQEIFTAEKSIGLFPGWSEPEADSGYSWFNAPLEIGGITEAGLTLQGGCYPARPERHVNFELRVARRGNNKHLAIERLDWRPLDLGHSNPRNSNSPLAGVRVEGTHLHAFELNWSETEQRMRKGNLRIAKSIPEPLQEFEELRAYVGKRLNINNIDVVTRPPWVYDLFSGGMR